MIHLRSAGQLRTTLIASSRPVFAELGPWNLVDFPDHFNCGDSAIWAGQLALAHQLDHRVATTSSRFTYRKGAMAPDGPIVFQGGGNFGGLYPAHHDLRLRILKDFPGRPIVQMPQSVEFPDTSFREDLKTAIRRHGNFTLLVRDRRSYDRAISEFNCTVVLVPDVAFALGPQSRPTPRAEVAVQERTDHESGLRPDQGSRRDTFDWLEPDRREIRRIARSLTRTIARFAIRSDRPNVHRAYGTAANSLARANLRRGFQLVSQAELLVTDRLHGHVMASLAGVPHIVVNDRFGKVEALWSTWTSGLPGARFARSWDEARALTNEATASVTPRASN